MTEVYQAIEASRRKYEDAKKFPKARKWLSAAGAALYHYRSCIDVFSQIDPGNVCLVWGSLKVVLLVGQLGITVS